MSDKESPFGVQRAEESPGLLLWQVTNAWQRLMRSTLEPFGLTHVQFVLLATTAWLTRSGAEVTQVEIAEHARTDVMMTSQVIRALESKQLVRRSRHSTDGRAFRVELTNEGRELARRAVPAIEGADAFYFGSLGERQQELIELLHRLSIER